MAASTLHITFAIQCLKDCTKWDRGDDTISSADPDFVRFGSIFMDLPFYDHFYQTMLLGIFGIPQQLSPLARRLHSGWMDEFIAEMISKSKGASASLEEKQALYSFIMGIASHQCLDEIIHGEFDAYCLEAGFTPESFQKEHNRLEIYQTLLHHRSMGIDLLREKTYEKQFFIVETQRLEILLGMLGKFGSDSLAEIWDLGGIRHSFSCYLQYQKFLNMPVLRWMYGEKEIQKIFQEYKDQKVLDYVALLQEASTRFREKLPKLLDESPL